MKSGFSAHLLRKRWYNGVNTASAFFASRLVGIASRFFFCACQFPPDTSVRWKHPEFSGQALTGKKFS